LSIFFVIRLNDLIEFLPNWAVLFMPQTQLGTIFVLVVGVECNSAPWLQALGPLKWLCLRLGTMMSVTQLAYDALQ
jgi:hypothetical protein